MYSRRLYAPPPASAATLSLSLSRSPTSIPDIPTPPLPYFASFLFIRSVLFLFLSSHPVSSLPHPLHYLALTNSRSTTSPQTQEPRRSLSSSSSALPKGTVVWLSRALSPRDRQGLSLIGERKREREIRGQSQRVCLDAKYRRPTSGGVARAHLSIQGPASRSSLSVLTPESEPSFLGRH